MYPLLLHLFQAKLQNKEGNLDATRDFSDTTRALLQTCQESCKNMIGVLTILQQQGLLGTRNGFKGGPRYIIGWLKPFLDRWCSSLWPRKSIFIRVCFYDALSHSSWWTAFSGSLWSSLLSSWRIYPPRTYSCQFSKVWDRAACWNDTTLEIQGTWEQTGYARGRTRTRSAGGGAASRWGWIPRYPDSWAWLWVMCDISPGQMLSLAEMIDGQDGQFENEMGWMDNWLWNHEGQ